MEEYLDIIDKIEHYRRFGRETGLALTGKLLEHTGRFTLPYIHIAGTNGKGSTAAFLNSILIKAGYKVGLFTSPHLIDFTERIRVNNECITREHACAIADRIFKISEENGIEAGMFDYCTVIGCEYFKEKNVDIAIMETGLGGRFDSTNAIGIPVAAAITPIGLDHMAILGNTIKEIAGEKAGIIKDGVPVAIGPQEPDAMEVLLNAAIKAGSDIYKADVKRSEKYTLGLLGRYQLENAATALCVVDILRDKGYAISEENVVLGLKEARWPGRLDRLFEGTNVFIDGAHNIHGVKALKESLVTMFPGQKIRFLMGVLSDKDYRSMLSEMVPIASRIDTVTPPGERALQGNELSKVINEMGVPSEFKPDLKAALTELKKMPADEPACIFGSLYFVGEIMEILQKMS